MNIISTQSYTSTVREFGGFTSNSIQKSQLAVDFGNSNTMTLNACLSHLYNLQVIDYKTKKSYSTKSDYKKIELIKIHFTKFIL